MIARNTSSEHRTLIFLLRAGYSFLISSLAVLRNTCIELTITTHSQHCHRLGEDGTGFANRYALLDFALFI